MGTLVWQIDGLALGGQMDHTTFCPSASPLTRGHVRFHSSAEVAAAISRTNDDVMHAARADAGRPSVAPAQWHVDAKQRLAGFLKRIDAMRAEEEVSVHRS